MNLFDTALDALLNIAMAACIVVIVGCAVLGCAVIALEGL